MYRGISLGHLVDHPRCSPRQQRSRTQVSDLLCPLFSPERGQPVWPDYQSLIPLHSLKLLHLFTAGIDHWTNHPLVTDSNIDITTSSGIHGPPITEWIILTTLASSRGFGTLYEDQKNHAWGANRAALANSSDWVGKRVGIAGYGSIGRQGELLSF